MRKETIRIIFKNAEKKNLSQIYLFERAYIMALEPNNLDKWDAAKDRIMALLTDNLDRMVIVTVDGVLAGHAYWAMSEDMPCVYSVYITDKYRRMGLASGLMNELEKSISLSGFSEVSLSTLVINPAQHLFTKIGYVKTKTEDGWIHFIKRI